MHADADDRLSLCMEVPDFCSWKGTDWIVIWIRQSVRALS